MQAVFGKLGVWFVVLGLFLSVAGCQHSPLPSPYLRREDRGSQVVQVLLSELHEDWVKLQSKKVGEAEKSLSLQRYNRNLLRLVRRVRYDVRKRGMQPPCAVVFGRLGEQPLRDLSEIFDEVIPAADVHIDDLEEHHKIVGIGVPMVGVIPAQKLRKDFGIASFRAHGAVCTLTAVMDFRGGAPVVSLLPRHEHEDIRLGANVYTLAGDFSAAIETYWNLTEVKKDRFLGLLRPQRVRDSTGLICMERYDPEKIPVVLVHGLASSAATFGNMVNRLMSDSDIRKNFQFWYYNYPTGLSWVLSAKGYRTALQRTREHFDPNHKNRNWERMVVVGHSMGGLITHYSQCTEPWEILRGAQDRRDSNFLVDFFDGRYHDTPTLPDHASHESDVYHFRPIQAGRVVYMATPHRGAPLARNRFVMLLSNLMYLPQVLVHDAFSLATLQEDILLMHPSKMKENFTSVRQLSPDSYSIRGLSHLRVRNVPTYSIIGDRGYNNSPRSSDGIVPYWSSHIAWGNEDIVSADHHVQDADETVPIFSRILHAALRDRKLEEAKE